MVKIFLDTANIDEIREAASWGVLDGITTNPTLVSKTGRKWGEVIQDILALVDGPISLETVTLTAAEMAEEGRRRARETIAESIRSGQRLLAETARFALRREEARIHVARRRRGPERPRPPGV